MIDSICIAKDKHLCDICDYSQGHLFNLTLSKMPPNIMDFNGNWIGGYSQEKGEIHKKAIKEAAEELLKTCVDFGTCDGDGGFVCIDCIKKVIE